MTFDILFSFFMYVILVSIHTHAIGQIKTNTGILSLWMLCDFAQYLVKLFFSVTVLLVFHYVFHFLKGSWLLCFYTFAIQASCKLMTSKAEFDIQLRTLNFSTL